MRASRKGATVTSGASIYPRMTRILAPVTLLVVVVLLGLVDAQISNYFTSTDLAGLRQKANGVVAAPKSLKGAYYAVQALKSSGSDAFSCYCKGLQDLLTASSSAYDMFYANTIDQDCKCDLKYPTDVSALARKDMSSNNLNSLAGGVMAGSAFGALSADEKTSAINKMTSLMTADGTFKSNPEDETGTTANVHLALEILAAVAGDQQAGGDLAVDVFEKAFRMLPGGDFEGETDATLMVPLSKLTDKKLRLVGDRLNTVAEVLLNKKHSTCLAAVSRAYDALALVAQYKASPLHLSFEQSHFDAASPQSHKLQLAVRSILGEAVAVEAAEVVSVKTVGRDSAYFVGDKFENGVLDMSGASLAPGRYLAQVSVTVAGRSKPMSHQAYFAVTDSVLVRDVRFQLLSGSDDASSSEAQEVAQQNALRGSSASAMGGDSVRVSFQVASSSGGVLTRKPHQAVVRMTHQQTGRSVVFVAKKGDAGVALNFEATVSVADSMAKFDHLSGEYTVTIQVGDAAYAAPVEWVLGSLALTFPAKKTEHLPLYAQSLLHASDVTLAALPEISHVMRPPAKRASDFMATVFTALTLAPLAAFVLFVLSLGPNLARLASLPSVAALGCLALMLGLYVSYWLALPGVNFYQTIRFLCILTPITVVVGSFALGSVKAMRVKDAEAKDKQA